VFHFNRKDSEVRRPNKNVPCIYAGRDTHLRGDGTSAGGMRNKDGSKTSWNHVGTLTQDTKIADSVIRIMRHKGKIGRDIDHPAVFPVALPEFVIDAFTDAEDIVFEPFCGSGTTMLAAQRCTRQARLVEIAPQYVDVAIKRFQQNFPDVPVTLAATGQGFEAVAAERLAPVTPTLEPAEEYP
jgi:DNA modification methylase